MFSVVDVLVVSSCLGVLFVLVYMLMIKWVVVLLVLRKIFIWFVGLFVFVVKMNVLFMLVGLLLIEVWIVVEFSKVLLDDVGVGVEW